jgi:hypothetical protein
VIDGYQPVSEHLNLVIAKQVAVILASLGNPAGAFYAHLLVVRDCRQEPDRMTDLPTLPGVKLGLDDINNLIQLPEEP